uniref:G protein-coupled receptor 179 n=1 Tax=Salvator merianae TaxID=96440 RepID=A0A8D0B010_SALMN
MEIYLLGLLFWCFRLELLWATGTFQHQQSVQPKIRIPKAKDWMPSSSSASLASAFTWVPTPNLNKADSEGSEAAVAFLYSGDTTRLSQANCTQKFEVRDLGKASGPPPALRSYLHGAVDTLTHATNFLNMVFQTNDIRESSVREDVEWYHALVRSIIEGDSQVYRAILTFDAHSVSSKPQMMLQAIKENNEILLQDLTASAEILRNLTWENEWYNFFRFQRVPLLYKRILSNDLKTLDTPKWSQGDSYVMDTGHVKWSPPFLECEDGKFLPIWMVTLSSSFYGLKPDLNPEFKGVVRMDVKIQNIDINQCSSGQGWFANTHQCDLNSTQCVPQASQGFVLGRYLCLCKPGFYRANTAFSSASYPRNGGAGDSASQYGTVDAGNLLECRPCQEGCTTCTDNTPCLIQEDWSLRTGILAFQAFCMLAVFFSMLISYHFRKSKRIRASGVVLLEMILFGSLLLYFPVFILYFKPSIFRCIVLRWVRMLGFSMVYGTITLKLYRVLKVFLSRTAQRVPYMSSGRLLKMLALILLLVLWFLAAWTVGMLENIEKNIPLVVLSQTTRGLQFYICDHDRWDYMMVVAEMLFLLWGSFLCYATRTVPSAFHEPRYMGIALHNELITSAAFHVVRFLMVPSLHPDWTLLLFFIHTHVTTTMTLALLFIPKFLHAGSPLQEEIATEVYEDELDLRRSGSYLNSSITSAWSEHSLDPDDIRDELKKLYTQLEVHKTKKMTANNPHLQKKRSFKRSLGRSLMRRITEIPESMSRQCSKEEKDGPGDGSGGSCSGSYKWKPLDFGSSSMKLKEDSSSKLKAASSLKKSHSTYDHRREAKENSLPTRHDSCKEPPLLDSLMRKQLAKKASERSNSDSLDDSAPLVYKSASAHNLMADKKPLHPKPSPLQKSLSVATSAKEKALLLTSRAYLEDDRQFTQDKGQNAAVEDSTKEREISGQAEVTSIASEVAVKGQQRDDTSEETVSCLLEDGSSGKDTVCSGEAATAPSTPSQSRSQKHVTYSSVRSVSLNTSDLGRKRHLAGKKIPPEPPIRQQSLVRSLERKDIAPWTDEGKTQTFPQYPAKDPKDSSVLVNICPWETEESMAKAEAERTKQEENVAPLPPTVPLNRLASIAAEVCPWEIMEGPIPRKTDSEPCGSDSQRSSPEKKPQSPEFSVSKSSIKGLSLAIKAFNRSKLKASLRAKKDEEGGQRKNEKNTGERNEKPSLTAPVSVGGSLQQQGIVRSPAEIRAKPISKQATICPWDDQEVLLSPSKALGVCPWERSQDSLMEGGTRCAETADSQSAEEVSPIKLTKTISLRESVCPWESIDEEQSRENKLACSPPDIDNKKAAGMVGATDHHIQYQEISSSLPGDETVKGEKGKTSVASKRAVSAKDIVSAETLGKVSDQHDSKDTTGPSQKTQIKRSPNLSKATQHSPTNIENIKAEVSPWESDEVDISVKTQICPWEIEELPPKATMPREDNGGSSKKEKSSTPKAVPVKKATHQMDSVCPQEAMEMHNKIDAQTGRTPEKSDDRANVKAAICPWETSERISKKPGEDTGEGMKGTEDKKHRSALPGEAKDAPSKQIEKKSRAIETVCPWESTSAEASSVQSTAKTPEQSKLVLKASGSEENKTVEVCPWEGEAAAVSPSEVATPPSEKREKGIRTAVCPWEDNDTPTMNQELKKETSADSKEEKKGTKDLASEKRSNGKMESVCPWEGLSREDSFAKPKPKSLDLFEGSSKKLGGTESQKAAVCPWETEETEVSAKAEICKVSPAPADKKSRQDKDEATKRSRHIMSKSSKKASSPRDSICPWENTDIDNLSSQPSSKSPDLSKVGSRKFRSIDSLKTELCPWESQEAEYSSKADVCPWEVPGSPVDKAPSSKGAGLLESHRTTPLKQTGLSKTAEKMSSLQESICPWDNADPSKLSGKPERPEMHSEKSISIESTKAEVCPWEVDEKGAVKRDNDGQSQKEKDRDRSSSSISLSKAMEKLSSSREDICPWESMEIEEPLVRSGDQNLALSKAGSKKSDSAESLRAEVCPWEAVEEEVSHPWTAVIAPFEKGKLQQDLGEVSKGKEGKLPRSPSTKKVKRDTTSKKIEKSKSHQEYVHPRDSMDFDKRPAKSTRSLDLLQTSSKKSESVDGLKTEVCPWEFQEIQTGDKCEIHPWVAAEGTLKRDSSRASNEEKCTTVHLEKMSSPRESVCPWESMEIPSSKSLPKASSKKSDSVESLRAEVCPWETEDEEFVRKTEEQPVKTALEPTKARRFRQDTDGSPKGEAAATKKIEKTHSHQELSSCLKNIGEFTVKAISKSLDLSKAGSMKSESTESLKAEICPWETEEAESSIKAEACPWDITGAALEKGTIRKDGSSVSNAKMKAGSKPTKPSSPLEKDRRSQESICPWESSGAGALSIASASLHKTDSSESKKTEVCPWETTQPEASNKEDICPWETETVLPTKKERHVPHASRAEMAADPMKKTQRKPEDLSEHKPLCRSLAYSSQTKGLSEGRHATADVLAKNRGVPSEAEICPWEAEEYPTLTQEESAEISKVSLAVCPWEAEATSPTSAAPADIKAGEKPQAEKAEGYSQAKASICPWDSD